MNSPDGCDTPSAQTSEDHTRRGPHQAQRLGVTQLSQGGRNERASRAGGPSFSPHPSHLVYSRFSSNQLDCRHCGDGNPLVARARRPQTPRKCLRHSSRSQDGNQGQDPPISEEHRRADDVRTLLHIGPLSADRPLTDVDRAVARALAAALVADLRADSRKAAA